MQHAPLSPQADYLSSLNPAQKQAVETTEGPVLVLAGAGTGKTRVLTTRLAYLLRNNKAFPGQILAVTFTNKAAQEMKHRVAALMNGAPVEGWWLGTFHALAARMLRRHADLVGLQSSFTILDQDDQVRLIKQLMEAENIDTKKWPAKLLADKISGFKDKGWAPADVPSHEASDIANHKLLPIYHQYQARLKTLNACDFGDLLLHMIQIFKNPANAEVLADYHRRFKYVLVDEYQDTNVAQYLWLRLLAKGSGNICCVGDDDQSIYGWRGAQVENILKFEKDFPGAVVIRLEENYRSTGHILAAANAVIVNNEGRLGKELFTSEGEGEKVRVRGLWDGEAEARWVGEEIESLQNKKYGLEDIAVLVRAGFQTREFEERFIQLGLPYRVIGGPRFYERMEIRDALAYLRVVNQKDDDLALERIINTPKRAIGDATVQTLYTHARSRNISLYDALRDLTQTDELKPKVKGTIMKLVDDFERWRGMAQDGTIHHAKLAGIILDESGYTAMWQADKSPESPGRLENLKELVSGMEEFDTLPVFLEHVSLVMEAQNNNANAEQVTIMTLHGAKGLEFKCVFLPGWEEGLFPSQRSMDENGLKGLEEERRLAYVGITRARERAYISYAGNRRMYGSWMNAIPSRFVDELPQEHIEMEAEQGLYGNTGRSQHWDSSGFGESFAARKTSFIEGSARRIESKPDTGASISGYMRGDKVFHDKFGRGTIVHMDGHKLDIAFEKGGGTKRVMDSFITKAE
ncbi:MAG: DNA helicase II [Micavibrio aeruginosavorus]|uniref:DNA 3'-5' helicase n=1 Tax=Micavibrio aeruginosavorus TaxID=349221 RepID=A0A2W5NAC6_9BACT|nr:MAG: DNA helicase II [Micavibrio aeruginosavorus]